jgi:hypothetical protein
MTDICELHAIFLRNLFLLYLMIDEEIASQAYKPVFAKFLEFFHDDLFPEGYSDFELALENPNNFELAYNIFAADCAAAIKDFDSDNYKYVAPRYFTISQVRSQLNLIVKDFKLTMARMNSGSRRWVKSKKLPFE